MNHKIREIPAMIKDGARALANGVKSVKGTNVWYFILYGLMFDMVNNLWRPFAARFLERLGGGEFEIALLNALPGLVAAVVLMPGALVFRRFRDKKRATAVFILGSRAILLAIAFIPMFPAHMRPLLFVVFVALMNCPDAISQTSLQNLLGGIFNGSMRGQAIALRTKFGQLVIPVVSISAGLAITYIPETDEQRIFLYQIFFVVAFLLGLIEVFIFNKLRTPEEAPINPQQEERRAKKRGVLSDAAHILKDKRFRTFFVPAIVFLFTWQAGWPLGAIFQIMNLGANEFWFAVIALVTGLSAFLSGGFWQRLLRKRGNTITFVSAAGILSLNMFIFPHVPNVQVMAAVNVVTGFASVGINIALLNGVLGATPDDNRFMYLAFFNTAQNLSLFFAPFFAHMLLSLFGISMAMVTVGGMRVLSAGFVWLMLRKTVSES